MKIVDHCRCGASLSLSGPERDRAGLEEAREVFLSTHQGEGHGPCDSRTAFFARLRAKAGSKVDPLASAQSPERLAVRFNAGRRVEPKRGAE